METSKVYSMGEATVVVQVNPQENIFLVNVDGQKTYRNVPLEGFFKAQPKALGIVQIMIGVMVFSLGVLLTTKVNSSPGPTPVLIFTGITYWGSLIYISAGALSVVAQNKRHLCLVKASLGMNVFSAVTAGISIFLMSIEIFNRHPYFHFHSEVLRINIIVLVFTVPQFIISLCISGFACKASCNIDSTVINVTRVSESQ